jgi:hypothetical protein
LATATEIKIPSDRPVTEGEIASYWFEGEILVSLSKNTKRTVQLIKINVSLVRSLTGGKPAPLLIYLSDSPVPDKETRKFSVTQLPLIYSAMAMVSKPGLAQLIMKMVFALKPPPIPTKSFSNKEEAVDWLKQFIKH